MFEKFEKNETTIIGHGIKVEGEFGGQGDVELYGEFKGNISISGFIKIGPAAVVSANITALRASIAGTIKGKVTVKKDVDLLPTAKVHGDIRAEVITVARGAYISGRVTTEPEHASSTVVEPQLHKKRETVKAS